MIKQLSRTFIAGTIAVGLLLLFPLAMPNTLHAQTYTETVGGPGTVESAFANVGGWRIVSGQINGRFAYCVAEKSNLSGALLRLGYDGQQWQLSFPFRINSNDWQGELNIDGDYRSASGSSTGDWVVVWLGLSELDRVRNGTNMSMEVGRASTEDYQLSGSAAAILKVEDCWDNNGRTPSANAAAPRNNTQRTADRRSYKTPYAQHGSWTVTRYTYDKAGRNLEHCTAVLNAGRNQGLRFLMVPTHFNYAFWAYGTDQLGDNVPMQMWFDNQRQHASSGNAYRVTDENGRDTWLNYSEKIDGPGVEQLFMESQSVSAAYNVNGREQIVTFTLDSSTQAISSLFACTGL